MTEVRLWETLWEGLELDNGKSHYTRHADVCVVTSGDSCSQSRDR